MQILKRIMKGIGWSLLIIFVVLVLFLIKTYVVWGSEVKEKKVLPDILKQVETGTEIKNIADWESQKEEILSVFEQYIYGAYPQVETQWKIERKIIDEQVYWGKGTMEQILITPAEELFSLNVILVKPNSIQEKVPLLLTSNFCGNRAALKDQRIDIPSVPYPSFCDTEEMNWMVQSVFGDMISTFPVEQILDEGMAFATFYPGEIVPDDEELAQTYLKALSSISKKPVTGAVSAWAWGYSLILDVLGDEAYLDTDNLSIYGHSRAGKSALWAAANDERITNTFALQSGTGGATLNQSNHGESITSMTKMYPHWFTPAYASHNINEKSIPVDQHHLLGLIAPRRVLLGNAQLDKWSDPRGAFLGMKEVRKIYDLYEEGSFNSKNLKDFLPEDKLSYWFRGAPHGVRTSDWEAFLEFLRH